MISLPRTSRLDAMPGASENRTELYLNTAMENRNWQRRSAPRAAGAASLAGWQGSAAEGA
jgi:hypothetical protein